MTADVTIGFYWLTSGEEMNLDDFGILDKIKKHHCT